MYKLTDFFFNQVAHRSRSLDLDTTDSRPPDKGFSDNQKRHLDAFALGGLNVHSIFIGVAWPSEGLKGD